MMSDFARVDVAFSSQGIDAIEAKFHEPDYIAGRVKDHWYHLQVERGQVMMEPVAGLERCECELCVARPK